MMKKFAFYLPQYHEIPENNKWWGNGFTEWTNVKNAKPLFKNHKQPKEPLNDNYYNLLDSNTVKWQTDLLKKYNIDGFIYYHYYFKGKLLLEKPAENLLKNKSINQKFFFCWANHSWRRSWNGSSEILIEQTYGDIKEWEKHFQYLLPFFKDNRYEKKDNMPLFMIFNLNFKEKNQIIEYFNKRCIEEGFNGIYAIESFLQGNKGWKKDYEYVLNNLSKSTKKICLREPNTAQEIYNSKLSLKPLKIIKRLKIIFFRLLNIKLVTTYNANLLYKLILNEEPINDLVIHSIFFEWDNTSRHKERGYIINPPSKEMFEKLMNSYKNEEYIFINAWNEWAEGMMLEPTKENKYKYLEWIEKY